MRKPLPVMAVLMSLIIIALAITIPLRNSTYTFLTSVNYNNKSSKPVIFRYDNSNNHFIDELADFTYVAHRGAPIAANEPENSLPAFKTSKKLGFKIVETDLQLTKDGQWVIMHDHTLDRTSTGKGTVKSRSLNYIKKLNLKGSKNESLSIPALDDFLSLCSSEALIPILDIKPNEMEITSKNYDSLLISLSKHDLLDKSIFTSSSKEVLSELRRRDNLTTIAVMMDASQDNLEFTKKLDNAFIYYNYENLTDEKIDLISKNNLRFGVWTINDQKVAKHFLEKGALMIVTDNLLEEK
jgi:glycerophosphoryl diester phosphodiesterase